jgi:hypothetical protein
MRAITTKNGFTDDHPRIKKVIRKGVTQTRVWIAGVVFDEDRSFFIVEKGEVQLTNY